MDRIIISEYRRLFVKGGSYFFTLVTSERRPFLCEETSITQIKKSFQYAINKYPFRIDGLVILPDHLHCIWQLPKNDHDFSSRWNMFKRYFSMSIDCPTNHRREKNIWQRRFWEHNIPNEEDLKNCLDYIHYNPVKHSYVKSPQDWRFSTFKKYVKHGYYDIQWGSNNESSNINKIIMNE